MANMDASVDERLRLIAVHGADGGKGAFLWNRYQRMRYRAGDQIAADVEVTLTETEIALLKAIEGIEFDADGAPADILASIIAKVFTAGYEAGKK